MRAFPPHADSPQYPQATTVGRGSKGMESRPDRPQNSDQAHPGRWPGLRCADKMKTLTGERPSTDKTWQVCVAEGNCGPVRGRGEQPEANSPAQNSMPMQLNSIRPVRTRRACLSKAKPVAHAMLMAPPSHVQVVTIRNGRVLGVSRAGKCRRKSQETCAGARRERRRSQSPRSSCEAGNDRGAKGGRKVNA